MLAVVEPLRLLGPSRFFRLKLMSAKSKTEYKLRVMLYRETKETAVEESVHIFWFGKTCSDCFPLPRKGEPEVASAAGFPLTFVAFSPTSKN